MINSGDKLMCTSGNHWYTEGEIYTVGYFLNDKFFAVMSCDSDEYWYASKDSNGICVHFNALHGESNDAWFVELEQPALA